MRRSLDRSLAVAISATALAGMSVGLSTSASAQITDLEFLDFWGGSQGEIVLADGSVFTALWAIDADEAPEIVAFSLDVGAFATFGAAYAESSWGHAGLDTAAMEKVNWILSIWADAFNFSGGGDPADPDAFMETYRDGLILHGFDSATADALTPSEMVAGVQGAIWHFTDGVTLDPTMNPDEVNALFEFLTGAMNVGTPEPIASDEVELSISPDHLSGHAGTPVGPYTISTNVGTVTVNALTDKIGDPLPVVDDEGNQVSFAADGDSIFIDVPADALESAGSLRAATNSLFTGRALVPEDAGPRFVTLSADFLVHAFATAEWTLDEQSPSPSPTGTATTPAPKPTGRGNALPATGGGNTGVLVVVGAVLLSAGAGMVIVARRSRRTTS